ncbi:MAG TPA: acylglycerol kinase family protein, partial [Longimicrobiales bacterium]|nr:acylglycerol kinase family protein [Longimicrobiales bacterium]
MSVAVILNPVSGGGTGQRVRRELERGLAKRGVGCTVHETAGPGDALRLAQQLASAGAERIVAAGGDGTVHDVANGILRSHHATTLGVLPIGTG